MVDGFGTAYSSLPHPGGFPVECPNVDRSLVSRLGVKPEDAAIVSTIMSLAHALGWGVTRPEAWRKPANSRAYGGWGAAWPRGAVCGSR